MRSIEAMWIWTLGHSTRSIGEMVFLLRESAVVRLLYVHTPPRNRHNPQYTSQALRASLPDAGTAYARLPGVARGRHPRSRRLHADAGVRAGPRWLLAMVEREPIAVMCREANPDACHRSHISDGLSVRGMEVRHIMETDPWQLHLLTYFGEVAGTRVTYPFVLTG